MENFKAKFGLRWEMELEMKMLVFIFFYYLDQKWRVSAPLTHFKFSLAIKGNLVSFFQFVFKIIFRPMLSCFLLRPSSLPKTHVSLWISCCLPLQTQSVPVTHKCKIFWAFGIQFPLNYPTQNPGLHRKKILVLREYFLVEDRYFPQKKNGTITWNQSHDPDGSAEDGSFPPAGSPLFFFLFDKKFSVGAMFSRASKKGRARSRTP